MKKTIIIVGMIFFILFLALFAKKVLHINISQISNPTTVVQNIINTPAPTQADSELKIQVYSEKLPKARVIAFDPNNVPIVSLTSSGKIVALPDTNKDLLADKSIEIVSDLKQPHGIVFTSDRIIIAETHQVISYTYNPNNLSISNKKVLFSLPSGGGHYTRTLLIKNDKLYISVGSSCNVCFEKDKYRSAILQSNLDGSDLKIFASGLRNSVFMTLHPQTNDIWATEMGRDNLGDDIPPDEINILQENANYGWPLCYGKNIHDTKFDKKQYIQNPCETIIPSHIDLQAHSAPLGLAFFPDSWPETFQRKLLIAHHGSWNRSVPTGYKLVTIDPETGQSSDLFTNQNFGQFVSRPVDVKFNSQGQLFVTDDKLNHLLIISP